MSYIFFCYKFVLMKKSYYLCKKFLNYGKFDN